MNEWENACLSSDFFCSLCLFGWHHQVPVELQWIYARILHLNTFWDLFAEIDFIFLVLNKSPSFGLSPTNLPSDPPWKRNWWNLPEVCVSTSKICCSLWKCLYDMMILLLTWMKTMIRRAESARRFIWKFNGLICCQMRSTKEQVKICIIHIQFDWKCQKNIVNKVSILLISRKVLFHDHES